MGLAELRLEGISKRFGRVSALRGVDLTVRDGEYLTLVGPTGAGKTTLLNVVAGLVRPDGGRVLIGGREVTHLPPEERGVGLMPQGYALFPHMSAWGNVTFGPRVRGWDPREVDGVGRAALEMVGLLDRADALPRELSGGMQQRVALARALAARPDVLLLDEPLRALDALLRVRLRYEVRGMAKSLGVTAVHVTHDYEEALAVGDRVAVLRAGSVVEVGTPEEVYGNPKTLFTAYFVGESNIWLAEAVRDGEGSKVRVGRLELRSSRPPPGEGGACAAAVRTRAVRVGPPAGPGAASFRASVEEVRFLGRTVWARASARGVEVALEAPASVEPILRSGSVLLSIDPGDVLLYPEAELDRYPEVAEAVDLARG